MALLSYADIHTLLPHRYPMLMVDAVLSIEPRQSIVAIKCVTGNEPCYAQLPEGVSLRQMAYPTSLIVESFSQAGAILWARSNPADRADSVLMFGMAKDCEFEREVFPGDTMEHRVRLEHGMADGLVLSGETWVGDTRVARLGWLMGVARPSDALAR
jgi:3-hydroxyacyl-[acyl-carrier-protein] dehydratase